MTTERWTAVGVASLVLTLLTLLVGCGAVSSGDDDQADPDPSSTTAAVARPSITAEHSAPGTLTVTLTNPMDETVTFWAFVSVSQGSEYIGILPLTPGADPTFLPGQTFRDDDGQEISAQHSVPIEVPLPDEMEDGDYELAGEVVLGGAVLARPVISLTVDRAD